MPIERRVVFQQAEACNGKAFEKSKQTIRQTSEVTVNQDIRDDLISHDIDLRKVDGDTRNKINKMLDKMEQKLKVAMVEIDPFTTTNTKIKNARLKRLEERTAPIIAETYRDIQSFMNERGKRVVVAESKQITNTIHDNIPQS